MSDAGIPPAILLDGVSKRFEAVLAVDNVSLEIREGEFFSLLGPSGCGKTTTLRMLAGFELPDQGTIFLRGQDVTFQAPNKRAVNMVFQDYELFPHMTVFENVSYGLKLKKVPKKEITERVSDMLEIVGVGGLGDRNADQLSGGQQQRVALARALVNRPAVLLLDEPLSALDVKLRKRMQLELKSIQHNLGTTFVYVTHDQEEALLMSDRVGIMNEGCLLQVGSPRSVYENPEDTFVADFVGTLNRLEFHVDEVADSMAAMHIGQDQVLRVLTEPGQPTCSRLHVAIRPERVSVVAADQWQGNESENRIHGTISDVIYLGPITQYLIDTDSFGRVTSQQVSDERVADLCKGLGVVLTWPVEAAFVLGEGRPDDPLPVEGET